MLNVGVGVFWQVLSAYNANFDIMDETGSTPMHYAAMSGRELCIRFLAQRGTSNSAVTERPRDASCLLVVSFNSTKHRAQSSIATSLFVVVVHAGCDKQNSLIRSSLCSTLHGRPSHLLFALQQSSIDSQIFLENRDFWLPHLHLTPLLWAPPSECCHYV